MCDWPFMQVPFSVARIRSLDVRPTLVPTCRVQQGLSPEHHLDKSMRARHSPRFAPSMTFENSNANMLRCFHGPSTTAPTLLLYCSQNHRKLVGLDFPCGARYARNLPKPNSLRNKSRSREL